MENLNIIIPEYYKDLKVTGIGGYFGRGLPMPFYIDISEAFDEKTEWINEIDYLDEIIELPFVLKIPENISYEDIKIDSADYSQYRVDEDKIIEYHISIQIDGQ